METFDAVIGSPNGLLDFDEPEVGFPNAEMQTPVVTLEAEVDTVWLMVVPEVKLTVVCELEPCTSMLEPATDAMVPDAPGNCRPPAPPGPPPAPDDPDDPDDPDVPAEVLGLEAPEVPQAASANPPPIRAAVITS